MCKPRRRNVNVLQRIYRGRESKLRIQCPESAGYDQAGKKAAFRTAFRRAIKKKSKATLRLPPFEMEGVEDFYTYFVDLMGVSEDLFWYSEWSFLMTIVENRSAVNAWKNYAEEKMMERK